MEHTSVSDVEQHGHKDVVHQIQSDAVSKQRVPHHQQVLKWKLAAKQQTYPPAERAQRHNQKHGNCGGEEKEQSCRTEAVFTDMPYICGAISSRLRCMCSSTSCFFTSWSWMRLTLVTMATDGPESWGRANGMLVSISSLPWRRRSLCI